jgi:excisionase family DNA binding protein
MPASPNKRILKFKGVKYYHITRVCEILQVTRPTIQKMINDGALTFCRINGCTFIPEPELEAMFKWQRKGRGPARKKSEE